MNKQLLMYIHSVFLLKTIESDNRECKYRRHFQGRERSRFQSKIFICHWESNCFITKVSLFVKKKKTFSSLFELIFLFHRQIKIYFSKKKKKKDILSLVQGFRHNSLQFHFEEEYLPQGLKWIKIKEGLNESKANVNGKADPFWKGSSSTVETLFLYPFRDTIRHNIAH